MPAPYVVEITHLPGSALGHSAQFVELLRAANMVASLRRGRDAPRFAWRWADAEGLPHGSAALPYADEGRAVDAPAQAVFVASLHCPDIPAVRAAVAAHAPLARRLTRAFDQGLAVCTFGNAAWFAAHSGRCTGRTAVLPWFYMAGFAADFPGIALAVGHLVHEDGPWLSASHPQALVPQAVALTRRAFGDELADTLASALLPDHEREHAARDAMQARHIPRTRASTLARAIAWLEGRVDQPYDLVALAAAASVSPRTLLRHFRLELGHSPLDHLHGLRCARARVLLEITLESVPTIAQACGYADPAAFRRIFQRHTGLAPTAYRERHTLRAPRRRWGVDALGAGNQPATSVAQFGAR